jgi:hypothetical protein
VSFPRAGVTERVRPLDDLLDEKIGHRIRRGERHVSGSFEQFPCFSFGRQRRSGWIHTTAFCFLQRTTQERIVAALGRDQRAHAVGERKADAPTANLFDQFVAFLRAARQHVKQIHKLFIANRLLLSLR